MRNVGHPGHEALIERGHAIERAMQAERAANPPTNGHAEPKPETRPIVVIKLHGPSPHKRVVAPQPWALRIAWQSWPWPLNVVGFLVVNPLNWALHHARKAREFARVQLSGNVKAAVFAERQAVCSQCPKRKLSGNHSYCVPCDCPSWAPARLDRKNWKRGWHCPERRHAGPYPDDAAREQLAALGYDGKPEPGGCGKCGG